MSRISGVEVFKGPAAIRYGPNTIGGAINLQTRKIPRKTSAAVDLAAVDGELDDYKVTRARAEKTGA